jgi:predicted transcriptional regulator
LPEESRNVRNTEASISLRKRKGEESQVSALFAACKRKEDGSLRRRGWGTITIDILEATLAPQKKMRIMYKANLNYSHFNKYFCDFLKKGFIEETTDLDGKVCYKISQRGKTLLATLKKANELASSDEL